MRAQNDINNKLEPTIIPGSMRSDGSKRRDIKVKAGYVPQEMIQAYVIPQKQGQILHQKQNGYNSSTSTGINSLNKSLQVNLTLTKPSTSSSILEKDIEKFQIDTNNEICKNNADKEEKKKTKKRIRKKKDMTEEANEENKEQTSLVNLKSTTILTTPKNEKITISKKLDDAKKESNPSEELEGELDEETKLKHRIRNLKKKIKQIEILEEKKTGGGILTIDEEKKLNSKKDILREINDLSISLKDKS